MKLHELIANELARVESDSRPEVIVTLVRKSRKGNDVYSVHIWATDQVFYGPNPEDYDIIDTCVELDVVVDSKKKVLRAIDPLIDDGKL